MTSVWRCGVCGAVFGCRGHVKSGNKGADTLAGQGAAKNVPDEIDLTIPDKWNLTNAKLTTLSQAPAYARICNTKQLPETLKHKDIIKKVSDFLWKSMHNALQVGEYWAHIPGFEQWALCTVCKQEESIEHILTDCNAPECKQIWYCKAPHIPWPHRNLGNILGAALAEFKTTTNTPLRGASCLYCILMTRSAHMIWRLRCERHIDRQHLQHPAHSLAKIDNKWLTAMNTQPTIDRELTQSKYGKKAIAKHVVLCTWGGLFHDNHTLPTDWTNNGLRF
ncbi:hypothetical protein BC835DRAFT_1407214 [Cytidiella melzeri]|nr:hypothetical protein BC835DRAFT_1407214 [Cytidiella melzeri]